MSVIRSNPQLLVGVALCLGIPFVLTLVGLIMRGAGGSLKPIVFMAILIMPIALVFLVGGLATARKPGQAEETKFNLEVQSGRFADQAGLYGGTIAPEHLRDAKAVFGEFFAEAQHAELALAGTGETTLVAQFPDAAATQRASAALWRWFRPTGTSGDEDRGWRGKRSQNSDYFELLRTGRHLFLWTGLTKDAAARRRAATTLLASASGIRPAPAEPFLPALQPLVAFFQPTGIRVAGVVLMCAFYTLWYFKGAAWAGSSAPVAGVAPVAASELATRLEAVNNLDVPFRVERGTLPGEWFATWRYADAKWIDLARARGLRRTFRIRMLLDESGRAVRATDYFATYDLSAGPGGAAVEWKSGLGIVFFQREHHRVLGLQLDEQGRLKPELSYAYTFNLDEMKSPLRAAVTRAGWTWRPTVWQGPVWLRWLTE